MSVTITAFVYRISVPAYRNSYQIKWKSQILDRFFAGLIAISLTYALVRTEHYNTMRSISCANGLAATLALKTHSLRIVFEEVLPMLSMHNSSRFLVILELKFLRGRRLAYTNLGKEGAKPESERL